MNKIQVTFDQIGALVVIILILGVLVFTRNNCPSNLQTALISLMMLCAGYLWGSSTGSKAKDSKESDTTNTLIDALKNSTPSKNA